MCFFFPPRFFSWLLCLVGVVRYQIIIFLNRLEFNESPVSVYFSLTILFIFYSWHKHIQVASIKPRVAWLYLQVEKETKQNKSSLPVSHLHNLTKTFLQFEPHHSSRFCVVGICDVCKQSQTPTRTAEKNSPLSFHFGSVCHILPRGFKETRSTMQAF